MKFADGLHPDAREAHIRDRHMIDVEDAKPLDPMSHRRRPLDLVSGYERDRAERASRTSAKEK